MKGLQFQKGKKVLGTETASMQQKCVKQNPGVGYPRFLFFMHSRARLVYLIFKARYP